MDEKKRSAKRFPFQLPIRVKYSNGEEHEFDGETQNLSVGGIYFTTSADLREGDEIELVMPLPREFQGDEKRRRLVRCQGRVVRVEMIAGGELGVGAVIDHYEVIPEN